MKIRSDIVKVYKDVHIWVGIFSGLMLFIAFYAGAITMFQKPLARWATPPSTLATPPPIERTQALIEATLAAHPQAAKRYSIVLETTPEQPARLIWREGGRRDAREYGASFDAAGRLQVAELTQAPVAGLVDRLHQFVGLPFPERIARPIMGTVAMLYALALVSGLIVLLPTLVKDLFALRIGRNIKRMWLDAHNALGLVSLPLHLVMALTSVVFAFHDQFYDVQGKALYGQPISWPRESPTPLPPGARPLPLPVLLQRVGEQLPHLRVQSLNFGQDHGRVEGSVVGQDIRYGTRARTFSSTHVDPYSGEVDPHDMPGYMDGWSAAVNAFFMLHFGSFGGNAVRWLYFLLGLTGAALFYTGNLLWIESRRRKARGGEAPAQKTSARVLGALTIGVSLGCVAGISATTAATKWLPGRVHDLAAWHEGIYFAVFAAAVAWTLWRGAARGAHELLLATAAVTSLVPLGSLAGIWGVAGTWNHGGAGIVIDLTALAAVPALLLIARHTGRRMHTGHTDSIWSAAAVPR
ncbi:MAG: PepSY-associated TM helix domain-containing protein [Pseudomonas sp.]